MDSGLVDSPDHLGINDFLQNRVHYRKEAICAPIKQTAESMAVDPTDDNWMQHFYGASQNMDYTFRYNINSVNHTFIYTTDYREYTANPTADTFWTPIDDLYVPDRDITLLFIAFNRITSAHCSDDPVFAATIYSDEQHWHFDNYIGDIDCIEDVQFCNPSNDRCSPLRGAVQAINADEEAGLDLNSAQTAIVQRLKLDNIESNLEKLLTTRRSNWLRAQESLLSVAQMAYTKLVPDQWETEVRSLFWDGLAKIQWRTLGHTMSDAWGANAKGKFWEDPENESIYTEDQTFGQLLMAYVTSNEPW